jgi:hypothetical protein
VYELVVGDQTSILDQQSQKGQTDGCPDFSKFGRAVRMRYLLRDPGCLLTSKNLGEKGTWAVTFADEARVALKTRIRYTRGFTPSFAI